MKKIFVLFSLLIAILLCSCGKNEIAVQKADFETQLIELDGSKFEIPKEWVKLEVPSSMKQSIYAPKGANAAVGTSNVSFIMAKAPADSASISDLKNNSSSFEEQIKSIFPKSSNFKFDTFKAPIGDVFTLEYQAPYGDTILTQTQYYILPDNYIVVITATDIGDNVTPSVVTVAKHIINTFELVTP